MAKKYFTQVGERYGSLLVIESSQKNSKSLVECICGIKFWANNRDLYKTKKYCGKVECNPNYHGIVGSIFGYYKVNKIFPDFNNANLATCECTCICGNIRNVHLRILIKGKAKSCGCMSHILKEKTKPLMPPEKRFLTEVMRSYKNGAEIRNLDFNLSEKYFKEIINSNCHYCGIKPSNRFYVKRRRDIIDFYYNGIDRKDSSLGYFEDNCVPCCWECNKIKNSMVYEKFVSWINRIKNHSIT